MDAEVSVRGFRTIRVPVQDPLPVAVSDSIEKKWQEIINLLTRIARVPAGLIMRITRERMEVYLSSTADGTPYAAGNSECLGAGLYCETVIGKNQPLLVTNALTDPVWRDNPDVKLDMISYTGYPLRWPDGSFFGTICLLDAKENAFGDEIHELIRMFAGIVEHDLHDLLQMQYLKELNVEKDLLQRETHHQFKNSLNILLSVIQLEADRNVPAGFLEQIESRIFSLADLHSVLCSGSSGNVDVYLKRILDDEIRAKGLEHYQFELDIQPVALPVGTMGYIGILFNELITNSRKHAFGTQPSPRIEFHLEVRDNELHIRYADNGKGLSDETFRAAIEANSPGATIIYMLVEMLNGTCRIISGNGMQISVVCRLP